MRYKTTIEITSEAEDKNEALEIVGEYLLGNIVSGIDMKCQTKQVNIYKKTTIGLVVVILMLTIGAVSFLHIKPAQRFAATFAGINAVQPPLKTSRIDDKHVEFKKSWDTRQTTTALQHIIKK